MAMVLVSLSGGAGVVRQMDGATVVSDDVNGAGHGSHLCEQDPYRPGKSWVDGDRSVTGGLLPPEAVSVEVVDDLGRRTAATLGEGAYAAVIAQPNDGWEPVVCCRDAAGVPVRRPLPGAYPSALVIDTEEPCPACGAVDYEEFVPFAEEQWRSGRGGPGGVVIPNPVVACRICGHEVAEGSFFGAACSEGYEEDEADRHARIDRARAEERVQRWYANTMLLRGIEFAIYAVEGWPAQIDGSRSQDDLVTEITIRHTPADGPDPGQPTGFQYALEVRTSVGARQLADPVRHARETLEVWAANQQPQMSWEGRSHAAITLWLAAHQRRSRGLVLAAERTEQPIVLDGTAVSFLTLTASTGSWIAARAHRDLMITIAGHGLEPRTLALDPIADPHARLVGVRPPDPDP